MYTNAVYVNVLMTICQISQQVRRIRSFIVYMYMYIGIIIYMYTGHDGCAANAFACTGLCLSLDLKCNGDINCYDGSDERYCGAMRIIAFTA